MIKFINAKLNIGLNIVAKRADGYHNLETVFYPVGRYNGDENCPAPFCDILEINKILDCDSPEGQDCAESEFHFTGNAIDCPLDKNLVVKAFRLFSAHYEERTQRAMPAMRVTLEKHIPDGAGLGGGSADATFTLCALNELSGRLFNDKELEAMACSLGADCPVFVANRPAYAEGIGEKLKPVEPMLSGKWCAVVKPDVYISTREAFAGVTPHKPERNLQDLIKLPIKEWRDRIVNDFEASIATTHPVISEIKDRLYAAGALYASMSGSGSSLFGIFVTEDECKQALSEIEAMPGIIFTAPAKL